MSDIVERLRDEAKESETRCRCMCHEAAAEIARLREEVKRWKTEAMAARPFIDMRCIEAWQPDGFHPGIPTHIAYKAARAANGEVPHD